MAYERVYGPLGPERADYHAALIAAQIANQYAAKESQLKPISAFMPDWDDLTRQAREEADRGDD